MDQPTNTAFIRSQKQTRVSSEARPRSVGKELRVDLLSGSDPTEGIVSIQADYNGNVTLWIRTPSASLGAGFGKVKVHRERFDNWFIISDRSLLTNAPHHQLTELEGDFPLRWLVETQQYRRMEKAVVGNFNHKHHDNKGSFFSLGRDQVFYYASPVEQYLVQSGRTYFKGLQWNDLHRLQFDLETTDLNPERGEIFLIAITDTRGYERILDNHDLSEPQIIAELVNIIGARDPDIIENHNLFAFDLPFLCHRAKKHRIPLRFGRDGRGEVTSPLLYRSQYDGTLKVGGQTEKYPRFSIVGRELIDTLHAVKRWNAITRELSGHGLKEAAQHFGVAQQGRAYIAGDEVAKTWNTSPEKVRRYALDDVREVAQISNLLMGTSFALAQMLPMSFERIAVAGTATSIDMMFVRAYIEANHSLPVPMKKPGTFKGGMTELVRGGVIKNVVKADAESLYPSIMLTYDIKPESDTQEIFLPILKHLTTERLTAKALLKSLEKGSLEYTFTNAYQGALKILINSFFGYLGSDEFVTFNDPEAADDVTRYGREILASMQGIIEEEGGQPIELDTDGIYFSLPVGRDAMAFVESINEKLNRPGIKIGFDGHWQAMYSIGKKNYALLSHDGQLTTKGAGLKASDLEPFLATFLKEGMADLLRGEIEGLRSRFRSLVSALRNRELTAKDVSKSTRLNQEISEYQQKHQTSLPHYEAAIASGMTDLRAGETVTYYKASSGWKMATEDASDYDVSHYIKRLLETTKRFKEAFTVTDFSELFKTDSDLFDAIARTIKPVQQVLKADEKPWIELAHGFKLNKENPKYPVTRLWVSADDTDAIDAFLGKFDRMDIHRSQLVVYSPIQPTGKHDEYPRSGDFVLEIDGSLTDPDKMQASLSAAHHVLNLITEKLGENAKIRAFFNGGKSIYLLVSGLDPSPVYRLHEKHRKLAQAIVTELPDTRKAFIDLELYDPDQMLRMEGTRYPNGGYNVEIPLSLIEAEDWEAIKSLAQREPDLSGQSSNQAEEREGRSKTLGTEEEREGSRFPSFPSSHFEFYDAVTKEVPDEPTQKKSTAWRKQKATRHAEKVFSKMENLHDEDFPIPCVVALSGAIAHKESIGFNGRNKLISELTIRGRACGLEDREIENQIVSVFLSNGDPHRYGVLEADHRSDPNPKGFKLRDDFSVERLNAFDVSCSTCAQWCDVENCYRSKEFLPQEESPSYSEYRKDAQGELEAILNDRETFSGLGIIALDAGLSSGKSFSAMRKALQLVCEASVALFVPTHAAGCDIINQIPKLKAGGVPIDPKTIVSHVYGKREETCLPDPWEKQTPCTGCPIFKRFFKTAPKDNEKEMEAARKAKHDRIKVITGCKGKAMDLLDLQRVAREHGACASVISKILAHTEPLGSAGTTHNVLAVLPHAYLIHQHYQRFISKINPSHVFIDEADLMFEQLLKTHQASLTVAETRSRLDMPYTKACNFRCDQCHVHFADTFGNRIAVRRKLQSASEYDAVGQPQHFIAFMRESVEEVVRWVKKGEISEDIFDFDAIFRSLGRIAAALKIVPKGEMTPIRYFDTIQRTLENVCLEGVTLEKLSEGLTVTETNEYGETEEKEIRPPVYVATITVEPCITKDGRLRFMETDDEIVPDEPITQPLSIGTLIPSRQEKEALLDTDLETAIKTVLEFVNFCDRSGGKIGLYTELRSERSDAVNEAVEDEEPLNTHEPVNALGSSDHPKGKRGGIKSCAIRLRYLDVLSYKQVVHFLAERNTILLSGTFLNHQLLAESLLMGPDEIDYRDARIPLHDSALILHHNPQFGKLAPDGISLATFSNQHIASMCRRIVDLRNGTKLLTFEVNARQGNVLYNGLSKDQQNSHLWIQNECNGKLVIPDWCSPEVTKERFDHWLFIDKLRSSTARAVNRAAFDVSIVHGNGYFDWYDYLPFVHAIKQTVNPDADLDTHIEYNRQRAVLQALLRTPRDERRTVCLYLSGDMSHLDYPDDLKGRVVTTNRLLKALKAKYPDNFISNREVQIELLARVIAGFIDGTVTRDDIARAIEDFDFNGKYAGGKHEARKETVDLSGLSETHRYIVEFWLEVHKNSSDHAKVIKTAVDRLVHVDNLIQEKGFVDKSTKDKKGTNSDWRTFLDFLVEKEYLRPEKRKTSPTAKKPQTVYVKHENTANPHSD